MADIATEVPPPLQGIPTAKEKKYDRQLRLWGATGQIALEHTHILLINNARTAGVTGVETLKNLVLPAIGQFTVLDDAVVDEADLGVNFFLEEASLGKSRAEETVRLLGELNPDVRGTAVTESLEKWMASEAAFDPYTFVIVAAPVAPALLQQIQTATQRRNIPLVYLHSLGFYSHFSVALPPAFPIVDTHPDPTGTTDLRLTRPWSALSDFAREKTVDMKTMSSDKFAHIPYVCLLLHYLEEWKATHDGKVPDSYKEKSAFRDLVREGSATEENFDEACAAVLKSLNPPTAPSNIREILNAPEAQNVAATSPPFWFIANAIHQFYTKHEQLPLPGSVPDMKAQSETYIQLQNIYKAKAREDCAEVTQTVRALEKQTGRPAERAIDDKEIENFCKGAAHISLVRGRPLKVVGPGSKVMFGDRAKFFAMDLTNPESLLGTYIALLAWDQFLSHGDSEKLRIPGADSAALEAETEELTSLAHGLIDSLLAEADSTLEPEEDTQVRESVRKICLELARAGGAELHNIAALTGGLVAQECIKVITEQYVPMDNTCVFDGIESRTWVGRV